MKTRTTKRAMAWVLTLALVFAMLPVMSTPAFAEGGDEPLLLAGDGCVCETLCDEENVNEECTVCAEDFAACEFEPYCVCESLCDEENIDADCAICEADYARCVHGVTVPEFMPMSAETDADDLANTLNGLTDSAATTDGAIVNLTGNVTLSAVITIPTGVTLNVSGGSLTVDDNFPDAHAINVLGVLTVSSGTVTLGHSQNRAGIVVGDSTVSGTMTVSGGAVNTTNSAGQGIWVRKGTLTVSDGAVNVTNGGTGILVDSAGTMNVSGGTVTLNNSASLSKGIDLSGVLNVSGGMVNVTNSDGSGITNYGSMTITGGAVNVTTTSANSGIYVSTGKTLELDASGDTADVVLTLNSNANSLSKHDNGIVRGINGTTYKAKIVTGAAPPSISIFYPETGAAGAAVANTTYAWNANAGGVGAAGWKVAYDITYDANGGTVAGTGIAPVDTTDYSGGTPVTVLDEGGLTNTGQVFAGWTSGSSIIYPGDTFTFAAPVTLTAKWVPDTTTKWRTTRLILTGTPEVTSNADEGWKWYASPDDGYAAKTLVLTNAHIAPTNGEGITLPGGSTIVLIGDNYVRGADVSGEGSTNGIVAQGGLTVKGAGTLHATGGKSGTDQSKSSGLLADTITITSGTVIATGGTATSASSDSYGIYSNGVVTINGGTVTATGGPAADDSFGISASGNINLNGGVVIARSASTTGAAIKAMNKTSTGTLTTPVTGVYTTNYAIYAPTGTFKTAVTSMLNITDSTADITNKLDSNGYAWDLSDLTLTLNGACFNISDNGQPGIQLPSGASIVLQGVNVVRGGDLPSGSRYGIKLAGTSSISGSGSLTAIGGNTTTSGNSCGIDINGTVTIGSGRVTAIGGTTPDHSYGINGNTATINVNGGKLISIGGTAGNKAYDKSVGIYAPFGMTGGAVTAVGGTANESRGIQGASTLDIGNVTAVGGKAQLSNGIYSSGTMTFNGDKAWVYGNSKSLNTTPTFNNSTGFLSGAADEKAAVLGTSGGSGPIVNPPTSSGGGGGGGSTPPPASTVIVDGKAVDAGEVKTSGDTTTVTVNQDTINKQLETASNNVTVNIPSDTGTAVATLVVQNVDDMAEKDMSLTVQVGNVAYEIPTTAMDTSAILAALGADNAADVPISITITTDMSPAAQAAVAEAIAANGNALVFPPIEFTITATYNGKTVEVDTFGQFVSRAVEVTAEQAAQITTAIVVDPDGTTRHVPTRVYQQGGKWYAEVNSLTNSTYAFVFNEKTFADAEGKWYESAVNEMASRMVISGVGNDLFAGERAITRAEFAAIIVKALGLPTDSKSTAFSDVSASAWYSGAVGKAYEYNIVSGVGNGKYDPQRAITRQEAMLMTERAAKVAGFVGSTGSVSNFTDNGNVSDWALDAAEWNVGSGLIVGANGKLNPQSNITRAETATLALKLVQKAGLVDVRTKF